MKRFAPLVVAVLSCTGTIGDGGAGGGGADGSGGGGAADVARSPRRLTVDQVRAAIVSATGYAYEGEAYVSDQTSPVGYSKRSDVDLLDLFGPALGRPDYDYTVRPNLEPGVSFVKLVEDGIRYACGRAAKVEAGGGAPPDGQRRLFLVATPADVLPGGEEAIRANMALLAARFWGEPLAPHAPDVDSLLDLFRAASTPSASSEDDAGTAHPGGGTEGGWRSVCIAMAMDGRFLVY